MIKLETVAEVVEDLCDNLSPEDIEHLKTIFIDENLGKGREALANLFIKTGFGRHIRNRYGIWDGNEPLVRDCLKVNPEIATATFRMWTSEGMELEKVQEQLIIGEVHADDASAVIEAEFLKRLRELHADNNIHKW
jgi:hypothetical protein